MLTVTFGGIGGTGGSGGTNGGSGGSGGTQAQQAVRGPCIISPYPEIPSFVSQSA